MGSCRLMKRRSPAAPNSRMDENMQASRIVPARGDIRGSLRGHLLGVGGEFFPHCPHRASIRPGLRSSGGERRPITEALLMTKQSPWTPPPLLTCVPLTFSSPRR